ncbi:HNHc domain containing protein [uncultured Caudovirales phage]|uniref:HNHc domain containing protein n=1 Tax=uncultured Caudovirales phage TaxID=2100421 RepID=A0A6J5RJB1_9CAUD|nr:HNHc domain containing protein [uncultured Caudovirales phage]
MKKVKLIKSQCEIDGCTVNIPEALHFHHIIERTDINTNNSPYNLAIICGTHHSYVHCGKLRIIGVYPATKPPNNRILVYELDGKKNIDIDEPYIKFENKSFKIYGVKDE